MTEADRCGFTVVDRDGIEQPCDRPASGWRWYQDVEHEDTLDVACLTHENEGGRRLHEAEARLAAVEKLCSDPAYVFDVGVACIRVSDILAALGAAVTPTPQETCRHGKTEPHDVVVEGFPVPPRYRCPGRPATPEAATEPEQSVMETLATAGTSRLYRRPSPPYGLQRAAERQQ